MEWLESSCVRPRQALLLDLAEKARILTPAYRLSLPASKLWKISRCISENYAGILGEAIRREVAAGACFSSNQAALRNWQSTSRQPPP